jgi:2,4-dienoyl-CoA reductase-like NADH-dependent reductase (Old Yellow Enzyme family)
VSLTPIIPRDERDLFMTYLQAPLATGKLPLHNRLVMPPMATSKAEADGTVSQALLDYYDEKSRGGAIGLVIIEHSYISAQGQNRAGQPSVADDGTIEGLARIAGVIHTNGSKTAMQINHVGGAPGESMPGVERVAPSALPLPFRPDGPAARAMTGDEIAEIPRQFAAAAARVKAAGFDGVEIHSAHGYLLNQFFSPLTNHRTDEYGGDVHGRIRLHLEVIAAVRAAVGEEFPILLRLGAADYLEGGSVVEDSVVAAVAFEAAGVDMLDITGGVAGFMRPDHTEPGYFAELSRPIKHAVAIPVILTGGVTEPEQAEELLASGVADLIGVGRAILKDSGWAQRAVREA